MTETQMRKRRTRVNANDFIAIYCWGVYVVVDRDDVDQKEMTMPAHTMLQRVSRKTGYILTEERDFHVTSDIVYPASEIFKGLK